VSYFDHDSPNFVRDGTVITATGLQTSVDAEHHRYDFPAYWNPSIRQYVYYDGHNGFDYDLWYQPIYAAAAGKVIFSGLEYPDAPDHGYGNMVMVQHSGGYVTLYGHFSRLMVTAGQKVKRGQQIGVSGNTGHSTGPHLHFTVFHNCTPTDPYGWLGSGPDPLGTYQGESSSYLWAEAPFILNPAPHWPGTDALPSTSTTRIVLLKLPPTTGGTVAFTRALRREAGRLRSMLHLSATSSTVDMLQGALVVKAPVSYLSLYSSSDVASVASSDTVGGQKEDVLSALGQAALVTPHRTVHISSSHAWTGYLVQWEGRTLLVGRGQKGAQVDLRLGSGHGGGKVRTLRADPASGAYAIDLGLLSNAERARLDRSLHDRSRRGASVVAHRPPAKPATHPHAHRTATGGMSARGIVTVGGSLLLVIGTFAAGMAYLRRRQTTTTAPPQP
jgi:hypothetical protein